MNFTCLPREGFNYFIHICSFSLRVYLGLAESKTVVKLFSFRQLKSNAYRVTFTKISLKIHNANQSICAPSN